MKHTLENGKVVNIPDKEIKNYMVSLDLSEDEAIDLWLEDNDYQENEEQNALDEKAKKVKIDHGASAIDKATREKKPREVKVSDEKQLLFEEIVNNLCENDRDFDILKENKLIQVKIGEKIFKIDLIEQRKPKK